MKDIKMSKDIRTVTKELVDQVIGEVVGSFEDTHGGIAELQDNFLKALSTIVLAQKKVYEYLPTNPRYDLLEDEDVDIYNEAIEDISFLILGEKK